MCTGNCVAGFVSLVLWLYGEGPVFVSSEISSTSVIRNSDNKEEKLQVSTKGEAPELAVADSFGMLCTGPDVDKLVLLVSRGSRCSGVLIRATSSWRVFT